MTIYNHQNNTETVYSCTAGGMFTKMVSGPDFGVAYCTRNAQRFLNWMLEEEIKEEEQREQFKLKMLAIISHWERNDGFTRGGFNNDHYKKVLSRLAETVSETFTTTHSNIPKVPLKTIYPK